MSITLTVRFNIQNMKHIVQLLQSKVSLRQVALDNLWINWLRIIHQFSKYKVS